MNETAVERRARELASFWHEGQVDKSGAPYVGHLRRVSAGAASLYLSGAPHSVGGWRSRRTVASRVAAAGWVHDLLEDTDCPWRVLSAAVPCEVTVAAMALTHADGEPWVDYMHRIADEGRLAPWVKWADIRDNSDPARLEQVREHDADVWKRLIEGLPRRVDQFVRVMEAKHVDGPWRAAA